MDSIIELSQQSRSGHTQSDLSDSSAFAVHNSSFQATRNLYPMTSTFDANPVSFTTSSGFGPDASFLRSTSFGTDHIDFNIPQSFESNRITEIVYDLTQDCWFNKITVNNKSDELKI